jgi:hypothetical protein
VCRRLPCSHCHVVRHSEMLFATRSTDISDGDNRAMNGNMTADDGTTRSGVLRRPVLFVVDSHRGGPRGDRVGAGASLLIRLPGCWLRTRRRTGWSCCSGWQTRARRWHWWQRICGCPDWTASASWSERMRCTGVPAVCCWWRWTGSTRGFRSTKWQCCSGRRPCGGSIFPLSRDGPPGGVAAPQVQEMLTAWTLANRPRHFVYRIVGQRWDRRSHNLRDIGPQRRPV